MLVRGWLWLAIAASSIVYIEPAACDLLISTLAVYAFARGLRFPRELRLAVLLMGLFLVGNVLASVFSPEPSISMQPLMTRFYLVGAWWLLVTVLVTENPGKNTRLVWNAFLLAALIASVVGILSAFDIISGSEQLNKQGRIRAFFKDPNVFGPFLVPATLYALLRLEGAMRRSVVIYLGLLGVFIMGVLLSYSRGAWINFGTSLAIYLVLRIRSERSSLQQQRTLLILIALAFSAAIAVIAALNHEPVREMFLARTTLVQDYDVRSDLEGKKSRFDAQRAALLLAMQKPLGIGAGQSEADYYQDRAPHNLYLHVLVESGWIGGLAFLTFLFYTLVRASRVLLNRIELRGELQVAISCVAGILLQSLFIDSTHWRHFFLILALLWAGIIARERRLMEKRRSLCISTQRAV